MDPGGGREGVKVSASPDFTALSSISALYQFLNFIKKIIHSIAPYSTLLS